MEVAVDTVTVVVVAVAVATVVTVDTQETVLVAAEIFAEMAVMPEVTEAEEAVDSFATEEAEEQPPEMLISAAEAAELHPDIQEMMAVAEAMAV